MTRPCHSPARSRFHARRPGTRTTSPAQRRGDARQVDGVHRTELPDDATDGVAQKIGDQMQPAAGRRFPPGGRIAHLRRVHVVDALRQRPRGPVEPLA